MFDRLDGISSDFASYRRRLPPGDGLSTMPALPEIAAFLTQMDRSVFHAINGSLACPALDRIMPFITDLGLGHVQAVLLLIAALVVGLRAGAGRGLPALRALWAALKHERMWLVPALAAIVLTGTTVQGLKRIHRQRPSWFYVNEQRAGRFMDVHVHTIKSRRPLRVNGFPSGHTATTAALAVTLALMLPTLRARRRTGTALALMTLLIGLSRIYMADHWPLDVFGGILIGALCGWVVELFAHVLHARSISTVAVEDGGAAEARA